MNFHNVEFETSFGRPDQLPESSMPEIVFSGRSNVGKSSLINRIFNRKGLAKVSSTPGKTATINFFRLEELRFVDLPGYGYAKVSHKEKLRWADLMETYFNMDRDIVLVFQLIDMRHPPSKDDLGMLHFLIETELPFVVILTKEDKLRPQEKELRLELLQEEIPYADQITMIPYSSITGEGVAEIHEIIQDLNLMIQEERTS